MLVIIVSRGAFDGHNQVLGQDQSEGQDGSDAEEKLEPPGTVRCDAGDAGVFFVGLHRRLR